MTAPRLKQDHARLVSVGGFVVGLGLIVLLAAVGVSDAREASDAVARLETSHAAIEALDEVSARLGEAKSARRAYGLTGDEQYRVVYHAAVNALNDRVAAVGKLTADSAAQQRSLAELRPVVSDRLLRLEQQAAARDATGKDTPLDNTHAVENGKLDDSIRRIVSTMIGKERERLETNQTESRDRLHRGELIGGISGGAACALLLIAFGLLSREVMQRRRAEAAAQTALDGAEVLNRELEAFSYSVSHDLRAPLRSIDGFSQALLEDHNDKLDDEGKRHLGRVRAASQRMAQLIDDLLGLSRVTRAPLHLSEVDLSAVATACAEDLRDAFPDRKIELVIAGGLKARGDARLLRIVFDNLLGNAFKFTARRPTAHIEIGVESDDGGPAYFVRDDGVGFDPQYGDKLFGAFQRLHDARDFAGTGIGLATVQRIVRRHGGRIWASSEVDHGAVFRFTLGDSDQQGDS